MLPQTVHMLFLLGTDSKIAPVPTHLASRPLSETVSKCTEFDKVSDKVSDKVLDEEAAYNLHLVYRL